MIDPQILGEKPLMGVEVKEELEKTKKTDKELSFRAKKTEEYLNQMLQLKPEKAKELASKLEGLNIPRLKDMHIKKIVDIIPKTVDELKVIIQAYPISVSNENMKKITETVASFLPDNKKQ